LTGRTVIVDVPEFGLSIVRLVGLAVSVKSGVGMKMVRVVVWVVVPSVPETVTVYDPGVTVGLAVRVRVELTLPPDGGVMAVGENVTVTLGMLVVLVRFTVELKP
jgi:hypothetical protein